MMGDGYDPMHEAMIENGYSLGYGPSQETAGPSVVGVNQVTTASAAFQPVVIEVTKGTTVTWTNSSGETQNITFRNGMTGSATLQQGDTFEYTFNDAGVYQYYSSLNPELVGIVIVLAKLPSQRTSQQVIGWLRPATRRLIRPPLFSINLLYQTPIALRYGI